MILAAKIVILLGFILWAFGLSYKLNLLGYVVGRVGAALTIFAGVALFHQNPALAKEMWPRVFIGAFVTMVALDALSFVIRRAPWWVRVVTACATAVLGSIATFLAF